MSSSSANVTIGCALFLSGCLSLTHMIVGSIYLGKYNDLEDACRAVWLYCVLGVCLTGLTGVGSMLAGMLTYAGVPSEDSAKKRPGGISLTNALYLALLIWGCIIYVNISPECRDMYKELAPQLWTLFVWTYWYIVALFILVSVILCCALSIRTATGATSQV